MIPGGPHDMPPMGPPNMNQGPPPGPPMMPNFGQGEGPPNPGMMPPGGGSSGNNFYDNFYQQQQVMSIDGRDGEFIWYFNFGFVNSEHAKAQVAFKHLLDVFIQIDFK